MECSAKRIGCVVMAAGNASRFGENKLTAQLNGKTLIARTLDAIPKELIAHVVVVTQYPEIAALAEEHGFDQLYNAHPDWGISHTIAMGTRHLKHCDAILYLVSDQPMLVRSSVACVVQTWQKNCAAIVSAAHCGKRGNPCIFPQEFFSELLALKEDYGGSVVIKAHPDRLVLVEISKSALVDVDTPNALNALKQVIE